MKTTIDWLKFRTLSNPYDVMAAIRPAFGSVGELLTMDDGGRGKDGWESRKLVRMAGDIGIATIDYGGDSQRGWLRFDMPGSGCEWVQDWSRMASIHGVLHTPEIRRCDVALTVFDGSVTHERVLQAHADGDFSAGGRQPKMKKVEGSDPMDGRTVYVGARDSEKFVRCYEKGFELLAKSGVPEYIKKNVTAVQFDGIGMVDPAKVYRCEVEFKASSEKVIPWTILVNGDEFFAGANPFFASLLPGVRERRVQSMPDFGPKLSLQVQAEHLRKAYGGVVKALMQAYNDDAELVIQMLTADSPSEKLIKNGVLTVVHH